MDSACFMFSCLSKFSSKYDSFLSEKFVFILGMFFLNFILSV